MFLGLRRSLVVANRKRLAPVIDWILGSDPASVGTSYVWKDSSNWADTNKWKG